jgi:hypothetical protein
LFEVAVSSPGRYKLSSKQKVLHFN